MLAAFEAKDSAKVNTYYAPGAVIATPGRPAAKDARALTKAIKDDIADPNLKITVSNEKTEVSGSGDMAYRRGSFKITTTNPQCALLLIDYQPGVMSFIRSHDRTLVELNARYLTKAALAFDIPIILSTVGVQMGVNQPTIASLRSEVPNVPEIDRTSMDSWADRAFVEAVKKTGRKRLVMAGIVTEVCLAYPVVAALKDGYEVTIVTDAAGGLTRESHDVAVLRMIQAGAVTHGPPSR